jgi:N6-L-threonylcarbamoyladenine synthase
VTLVLGVETSCDDTAAAVVRRNADGTCAILSNEVWSEAAAHRPFGGVVPEVAARGHVQLIDGMIARAIAAAGVRYGQLDAVAATAGPGLVGAVMVGLMSGKGVALAHGLPLIPLNHLEGHALAARMTEAVAFPYLLLLVSGGHTQLLAVEGLGRYRRLGTTIDDAAGEAFDKSAKLLGLGQPGGPRIEEAAQRGRADRFDFPDPLARRAGCDFSLSGLKTAVRLAAESISAPSPQDISDLAASFQRTLVRHLVSRTAVAMELAQGGRGGRLVISGGVAANRALRGELAVLVADRGWTMYAPPIRLCTDNGAMIAWAGAEHLAAGLLPDQGEALASAPRARWPLAPPTDGEAFGGGRKGPKA